MSSNDQPMPDVAFHLDQLSERTTAAELVRRKGQSKQLKVISEKKLMDWILALMQQHMAGKVDAMSDDEKQELVAKAQVELQRRMKAEQELSAEKGRRAAEMQSAMNRLASSQKTTDDYDAAIESYKAQLEQRDRTIEDLQADNFDLRDELSQKIALLTTTITEKDRDREKLQLALRNQMVRSGSLVEGVLGLDSAHYGSRHHEQNPVSESASQEETFFHDFDVGAAIIHTLANDLGRLREIAKSTGGKGDDLLESDLTLLAQLKAGSLSAIDVASPVAGLVEAVEGARAEAMALEEATATATGARAGATLSAVPDADGKPEEVIAGTTQIVRELTALLARERQRLGALKSMADEADAARNTSEGELDSMRSAYDELVGNLQARAIAAEIAVPESLNDISITPAQRAEAAQAMLAELTENAGRKQDPAVRALETRLATQIRDLGKAIASDGQARGVPSEAIALRVNDLDKALAQAAHDPDGGSPATLMEAAHGAVDALQHEIAKRDAGLRANESELARVRAEHTPLKGRLETAEAALEAAINAQNQLASQLRDLGRATFVDGGPRAAAGHTGSHSIGAAKVHELDNALSNGSTNAGQVLASARALVDMLRKDAGKNQEKLKATKAELDKEAAQTRELRDRVDTLKRELAAAKTRAEELQRAERELSSELITAAKGDAALADTAADLALTLDDPAADAGDLSAHSKLAVSQLVRRKQELEAELTQLRRQGEEHQTRIVARSNGLEGEIARLTGEQADLSRQLQTARAEVASERARAEEQRDEARETTESAKEVIQQLKQQSDARGAELAALREQEQQARTQAAALRDRLAAAENGNRAFADSFARLAKVVAADPQLASQANLLEQALSDLPGDDQVALRPEVAERLAATGQVVLERLAERNQAAAVDATQTRDRLARVDTERGQLAEQLAKHQSDLAEAKQTLAAQEAENSENLLSAKEISKQLREQLAARDEKLKELRTKEESQRTGFADAKRRLEHADLSNRKLAETLSQLAASELATVPELGHLGQIEEARVDLELALSELPAEGEAGVAVPADLSQRLADAGHRAALAVTDRRRKVADSLAHAKSSADSLGDEVKRLQGDLQTTSRTLDERESALKRSQSELNATRGEMKEASTALAAKVQDLAETRSRLASTQADLDRISSRLAAREQELAAGTVQLEAERSQTTALAKNRDKAAALEKTQGEIVQSLSQLARWDDRDAAAILANANGPLAKAATRLQALDRSPEQVAGATQQFIAGLREQLQGVASDLAATRRHAAEQSADVSQLQEDLSTAKATAVAREHEAAEARSGAESATTRAVQAEATARELASAMTACAEGSAPAEAVAALAKSAQAHGQPLDAEVARAGVTAMHAVAEGLRKERGERARLADELATVQREQEAMRQELDGANRRQSDLAAEASAAREAEQALATRAADLSHDLLAAAKAMSADADHATSKKAADKLAEFERLSPAQRVNAAAEVMPALRELFTNLAIDIAETKAKAQTDHELHERESEDLRRSTTEARSEAERLTNDLEKGQEERANQLDQLLAARSASDGLAARLKEIDEQLLQANAELDDYRARGVESSGATGVENARLKQELATIRAAHDQVEAELAGLREKVRGGEARQAKLREEMNQRLEERDQILAEKAREIDRLQAEQADAHALAVKVDTITKELTAAHEQLKQYKQIHGDLTGVTAQAGDLKKAMKGKEAERESLQNKVRELEAELADKRGELDEAQSSIQAKQKEMKALREKKEKEIEGERQALAAVREAERKLKEENVGLKARVRRLTEHS